MGRKNHCNICTVERSSGFRGLGSVYNYLLCNTTTKQKNALKCFSFGCIGTPVLKHNVLLMNVLHQPNDSCTDPNQSPKSSKNQGEEISTEKQIGTLVRSQSENKMLQPLKNR